MSDPTERQQEVLDYIREYIGEYGYSPSYREIAEAIGVSSTNAVSHHIDALEEQGLITRSDVPNQSRNIQVVDDS